MIGFYISIVASILFSVFGLIGIIIWTMGSIHSLTRQREGLLGPTDALLLRQTGCATTMAIFGAPLFFIGTYVDARLSLAGVLLPSILITLFLVLFCIILWTMTLYLSGKAKSPRYLYLLPRDADQVRRGQCEQGVALAARFYPHFIPDLDLVDALSRSTQVALRRELYPKRQKGELQLTNDFAVYCNLSSEGFQRGYTGFLAACQEAPDHLGQIRAVLQQWPETSESERFMDEWAPRFLNDNKEE